MKIEEIVNYLDLLAPLTLQESYDNSGFIVGTKTDTFTGALLSIDITEDVVEEAIRVGANLIVAHHPIIFSGLKKITGRNYVERTVMKAIRASISIYACHTNLDVMPEGVSKKMCEKLGLVNARPLEPFKNILKKIVCFVPKDHIEKIRTAVFDAGAGHIGKYDCCSFVSDGTGSFRAGNDTKPFIGEKNKIHFENELRFELVYPAFLEQKIIHAIKSNHPYEEVAYDLYSINNTLKTIGLGMIAELTEPMDTMEFLNHIKNVFKADSLRYTPILKQKIKKIGLCGGSGSSLLSNAIANGCDLFLTADFKYHQFFDAENKIVIADIGHYESEQYTKEIFFDYLSEKFPNFAFYISQINTNPINYL